MCPTRRWTDPAGGAGLAFVVLLLLPTPGAGQRIAGQVLDEVRASPVAGALVVLLDRDGNEQAQVLADGEGRFVLAPPAPGEFYLQATRLGYAPTRSPLLALGTEGSAHLELMMRPLPIGLEGFEVEVDAAEEAAEELRLAGVEPRALGPRWIGADAIAAVPIKRDVGTVLEHQAIGGARVIRPENQRPGTDPRMGLCVSMARARTGSGRGTCVLIVLDGVAIRGDAALTVDPESVAAMALLTPAEATLLYGTRAGAGALLIWTKRGGGR